MYSHFFDTRKIYYQNLTGPLVVVQFLLHFCLIIFLSLLTKHLFVQLQFFKKKISSPKTYVFWRNFSLYHSLTTDKTHSSQVFDFNFLRKNLRRPPTCISGNMVSIFTCSRFKSLICLLWNFKGIYFVNRCRSVCISVIAIPLFVII